MLNMAFDVVLSTVLSKKNELEFFISCNTNHYKNILLFVQPVWFDMYFFKKTYLFFIMVIILFILYFDICIKFTLSTIILTMKKI